MKRLINILLILAAFAFVANSQVIRFNSNEFYKSYTGVDGDTASGTTAKNFDIYVGKNFLYYYDIQASCDSAGDASDFTVQIYGSNDESNWYTVGDAQTWYLSETDTVLQFTNYPSSESISIAAFAITKPERTDYVNGLIDSIDVDDWLVDDTITVTADTFNVAAQTHTLTKQYPVGWRYLRITFTGGGSDAKMELEELTACLRKKD